MSFTPVRCCRELKKRPKHDDGCLDVLCLNMGNDGCSDEVTEDGYNREAQVNVLAQALLLKEAFPLLERRRRSETERRGSRAAQLGARMIPAKGELVRAFFAKTSASEPLPKPFAGDSPGTSACSRRAPRGNGIGQTKLANARCPSCSAKS